MMTVCSSIECREWLEVLPHVSEGQTGIQITGLIHSVVIS
jgi:hypothetical protein